MGRLEVNGIRSQLPIANMDWKEFVKNVDWSWNIQGLISDHGFLGGHKAVVRPDPIPNSAVKHSLADGSGFMDSARLGCRQFSLKSRSAHRSGFCFLNLAAKIFSARAILMPAL
jgi:hypothetical protein